MSKPEQYIWLWLLGSLGAAATLSAILPPSLIILSYFLLIGFALVLSLPIFVYVACLFGVNLVLLLVLPRTPWLRLPLSVLVVAGAAWWIGTASSADPKAQYARLAAMDIPMTGHPHFSRLVFIDDRKAARSGSSPVKCDVPCTGYLYNAKAEAVLYPTNPTDTAPPDQRTYTEFTGNPYCRPVTDFSDVVNRIWAGACVSSPRRGGLEAGDLIIRRMDFTDPSLAQRSFCESERIEIYQMTLNGLTLVARQTSFDVASYGAFPMLVRSVNWNGSTQDDGVVVSRSGLHHCRYYDNIVNKDLDLDPDMYLMAARQPNASHSAAR